MYSVASYGDRTMRSFSIPPRAPQGMDEEVAKLGEMQWLIHEGRGIGNLARIVRAADDVQIGLARLHLSYALHEIKQNMISQSVAMSVREPGLLAGDMHSAQDVTGRAVDTVAADARKVLDECIRRPSSKERLAMLADVVTTLAEAAVATTAVSLRTMDERDMDIAQKATEAFRAINSDIEAFRMGAGDLYRPGIDEALGAPGALQAAGESRAAESAGLALPVLTDRRLGRAAEHLPYHLDRVYGRQPDEMRKGQAAVIRENTASVFEDFEEAFQKPGFLRALRAAAVSLQWHAERRLDAALDTQSDERKAEIAASGNTPGEPHRANAARSEISKEEWLRHYTAWRARDTLDGARDTALAADMRGWLAEAAAALRPDVGTRRHMKFVLDDDSGTVQGRLAPRRDGDRTLVIYGDPGCGGYREAVFAAVFDSERLQTDTLPSLEEIKEAGCAGVLAGTNYRGLDDAIAQLGNGFDQEHFMGCRFEIGDPARIPRPRMEELEIAAPGMR